MTDSTDAQAVETATELTVAKAKAVSKSATVQKQLGRAKGASLAEIVTATGWQAHSARAFLTGLRKKGAVIVRESRKDGETCYRITG